MMPIRYLFLAKPNKLIALLDDDTGGYTGSKTEATYFSPSTLVRLKSNF